jgi:hypothetical protein
MLGSAADSLGAYSRPRGRTDRSEPALVDGQWKPGEGGVAGIRAFEELKRVVVGNFQPAGK